MKKEITIIGAGLVGSLLSIYLAKRGYAVKIYDRLPDMRKGKIAAGRSINLALSDRGIKALQEVGIMDEIKKIAIPMHRCRILFGVLAIGLLALFTRAGDPPALSQDEQALKQARSWRPRTRRLRGPAPPSTSAPPRCARHRVG